MALYGMSVQDVWCSQCDERFDSERKHSFVYQHLRKDEKGLQPWLLLCQS
jgi:hypothetical protein